jgi:hypothetical protein
MLTDAQVAQLLRALERRYGLAPGAEITLELDPAGFDQPRLLGYLRAGVNRVSLGGQSFDDTVLASLGRRHRAADLLEAASWLKEALHRGDLASWSLDLIQGLPQPLECGDLRGHWNGQLEEAMALEPPHLSVYDLIVEPGTVFARRQDRGDLALPEEELAADLMDLTWSRLTGGGYGHYEISNYALPGHASRHNRVYWSGAGGGALGWGPRRPWPVTAWPDPAPVRGTPNGCKARNSRHPNVRSCRSPTSPDAAGRAADGGSAPTGRGEYGGDTSLLQPSGRQGPGAETPAAELREGGSAGDRGAPLAPGRPCRTGPQQWGSEGTSRLVGVPRFSLIQPRRAVNRQPVTVQQGGAEGWLAEGQSQQIGGDPHLAITVIPGADADHRNGESRPLSSRARLAGTCSTTRAKQPAASRERAWRRKRS